MLWGLYQIHWNISNQKFSAKPLRKIDTTNLFKRTIRCIWFNLFATFQSVLVKCLFVFLKLHFHLLVQLLSMSLCLFSSCFSSDLKSIRKFSIQLMKNCKRPAFRYVLPKAPHTQHWVEHKPFCRSAESSQPIHCSALYANTSNTRAAFLEPSSDRYSRIFFDDRSHSANPPSPAAATAG